MNLAGTPSLSPPPIGAAAPDFNLEDQNREPRSLSDGAERRTVLVFYRGSW